MQPLLSIVIPTRNRQKYCIAAIENILSYDYPAMELCIQDNSDDDEIELHIQSHHGSDSRLKYKRIDGQINSLINIGSSLGLANGKFVILIGDDDTILPNIFDVVNWMDQNNVDSLAPTVIVDYFWPNAHPIHKNGWMAIPQTNNIFAPKEVDVKKEVESLFKHGIINYLSYRLPKVYHGVIRRSVIEQIKEKTGAYAGGLSPDIYLCISLTSLVRNHYTTSVPLSIAGACSRSTTSQNAAKGHRGELSSAPHLYLRGAYIWDTLVPEYYSVDTIWAESALKAVKEMQISGLRDRFNFSYMAAFSLLRNRSIFKFAWQNTFNYSKHKLLSKIQVGLAACRIFAIFVTKRTTSLLVRKPHPITIDNVENIDKAVTQYMKLK